MALATITLTALFGLLACYAWHERKSFPRGDDERHVTVLVAGFAGLVCGVGVAWVVKTMEGL